ncbi:MAG TPA: YbaK/EbsC family protein [Bacillota bacterium]|nr:YbaK/EbsC family protein [Bacillota bacterium]
MSFTAAPEVERVRRYVQNFDPALEPREYPESTETAVDAARVLGVELGQIAKSILFKCGERYGLFILAGDMRMDQKKVKELLGGGKTKVASPEEVEQVTGFKVGGVCPFALKTEIPVFLDRSMQRFAKIYTAAGSSRAVLPLTFVQLEAITGGRVIDVN